MCNERISSDGPDQLSAKLKEHLDNVHEMKLIDEVTRFNSEPSGGGSPDAMKKIDEVTRFSAEPVGGNTPESMRMIEVVTRFKNVPGPGKSTENMSRAVPMEGKVMVNCPMYGSNIYGQDDDDLSMELREHIYKSHKAHLIHHQRRS